MGRTSMGRIDFKTAVSTAAFLILSKTLSRRCCRRQLCRRPQRSSTFSREALWQFWIPSWMLAVHLPAAMCDAYQRVSWQRVPTTLNNLWLACEVDMCRV